ncbi:MAG: hypothetical protein H0V09_00585, partial [Gemmatimonadetes bacterium]|nr:hypothetical protein [Gemmatimonadota bacterium]
MSVRITQRVARVLWLAVVLLAGGPPAAWGQGVREGAALSAAAGASGVRELT